MADKVQLLDPSYCIQIGCPFYALKDVTENGVMKQEQVCKRRDCDNHVRGPVQANEEPPND